MDVSGEVTYPITVIDIPITTDQALIYNATNIISSFKQTTGLTDRNTVDVRFVNLLKTHVNNTLETLYINNEIYTPIVGDVLKTNDGILLTVESTTPIGEPITNSNGVVLWRSWINFWRVVDRYPNIFKLC